MAMEYNELTPEEKVDVDTYDKFMRSVFMGLRKVAKASDAPAMYPFARANITPIMEKISQDTTIPTKVGYAGAKAVTAAEFEAGRALLDELNALLGANMGLIVKLTGVDVG